MASPNDGKEMDSTQTDLSTSLATESPDYAMISTVKCPLCQEVMMKPTLLTCLHNTCRDCLQIHINKCNQKVVKENGSLKGFPCPVCAEELAPLSPEEPGEKWASQFPSNFFLNTLSLIVSVQQGGKPCDPCKRRGVNSKAGWWCRDCMEFQCNVCNTVHSGFQTFGEHYIIKTSDLKHCPEEAVPRIEPCPEHNRCNLTLFCRNHGMACCTACVSSKHKKCQIIKISEEFEVFKKNEEIPRVLQTLTEYETIASNITAYRSKVQQDLREKKEGILSKIKELKKNFEVTLTRLEMELTDDFTKFHEAEMEKLSELNRRGDNMTKQISNAIQLIHAVDENGCDSQIMTMVEKVAARCKYYEEAIRRLEKRSIINDYVLKVDLEIEEVLKKTTSLGKVVVHRSEGKAYPIPTDPYTYHKKTKVKEISRLRVFLAGDNKRCRIVGGVFLHDGRILLADFDNYKVKLFAENGRLLDKLKLKEKPTDITMVNQGRFVVTFPRTRQLQFIILTQNRLSLDRAVKMKELFHGVSCEGDRLYLSFQDGIAMCNLDGSKTEAIKLEDNGVPSIVAPGYIKATSHGLYVTDYENNTVSAYSRLGQLLFTYAAKDFRYPLGIDFDPHENFYVCCKRSSNVHQFARDGTKNRLLLHGKEMVENPLAIVFQPTRDRFFISESKTQDRDYIRIFELF